METSLDSKTCSISCSPSKDILNTTILISGFYIKVGENKIAAPTLFKCWQIIYEAVTNELKQAGICDKFNRCTMVKSDINKALCAYYNEPDMIDLSTNIILQKRIIMNGNMVLPDWTNVFPLSISSIPIQLICSYLNGGQILPASLDNSLIIQPYKMNDLTNVSIVVDRADVENMTASIILSFQNQNGNEIQLVIESNTRRAARFMEVLDVLQPFTIFISMHRYLKMEHKLLLTIQKGDAINDLSRT